MQEDGWVVCRVFKKRNMLEVDNHHSILSDEEAPEPVVKRNKRDKRTEEKATSTPGTITCKKEEIEETPSPVQPAYLQLPQLESPKVTSNTPTLPISADFKRMFTENCKKVAEHPTSSGSESGPPHDGEGYNGKPFFMTEESLAEFIYNNGPLTDSWSVYDNIARYHLDFFNFPGDFSQSLHLTRSQPPLEYPSSCEVDLWNFTR